MMKLHNSFCFALIGICVFGQSSVEADEFPEHMVEFLRPGMYVGTPHKEKRNKIFVILPSEKHSEIYHDAIFRSLPELRDKYTEIDKQATIALKNYVARIHSAAGEHGDVNVNEPDLRFSGSASSYFGNTLYYSKIIHVGEDYILLGKSNGRREAVKKDQIEGIEWAPADLSQAVAVIPPKDPEQTEQ